MRIPVRAAAFAVAAAVVSGGCVGGAAADQPLEERASSPGPAATTASAAASASAAPSSATILPTDGLLPRSVAYGMLVWTVTGAAITNEDPAAYVPGVDGRPTATTSLVADLEIRNDDVHVTFVASTARLVVELPDGTIVPGKDLGRRSVPPSSTVAGRYAFPLAAGADFDGLVLRFEDPGREPSFDLPLTGPAPELERNVATDVDLATDVAIPGIDMTWSIERVIVGHDWPLPVGHKGGTLVPGARAATGHRFVGLVARVDVGRCDCPGGVLDQAGSARLLVDGSPYTAAAAGSTKPILNPQTFSDVLLVFHVPAGPSPMEVALQVGPLDAAEQQATFRLELD